MSDHLEHYEQQNAILRTLLAEAHRNLALAELELEAWKERYYDSVDNHG